MDVYAREGNVELAQAMFAKIESPNVLQYCLLIKAYGGHGQPEFGEQILRTMLKEDSGVDPNIECFNILLNAWASNATIPDAPNRALAVIRFMDHDLKCIQLGLQPDVVSFNTVLKCLAAASATTEPTLTSTSDPLSAGNSYSSINDVGQFTEDILNEMADRFKHGNRSVLPDVITYNT
jgi:pentatricopeptide repeat protein